MLIYDPNGTPVPLGQKLGHGGEADIYHVSDEPPRVAKIYQNPTRYRESKLHAMISNPPHDPTLDMGHASICWPKSLLFNHAGTCVGFLMHRVDIATHAPAFKLYNPMDRQNVSLNITWKFLIRAATNIAAAVEAIHVQGHVIGDFNESNILVANNALVTLVDCDSMQVRDPVQGTCFRCPVGKPEFTPPELQGCEFSKTDRLVIHDNFGLAVLTFLLLMEGVHPFSGVWRKRGNPPTLENRIRNGLCPYAGHPDVAVMPVAPSFQLLPPGIADLFVKCFRDGHVDPSLRPSPAEWKAALTQLEEHLVQCPVSVRHLYSDHLSSCPWCERTGVLGGVDPFPCAVQTIKPAVQPAVIQSAPVPDLSQNRPVMIPRRRSIKRAVAVIVLALAAFALWKILRTPVQALWSSLNLQELFSSKPDVKLSPMLICTGVDDNGVPTGVSDSYTQDQLRQTGIMAFLTYAGAVPKKTTFRMRWTTEGKTYELPLQTFEREADSIQMKFGPDMPPGFHQIEFLVDGKVMRNATMTIEPSSRSSVASASGTTPRRQAKQPVVRETALPTAAPPAASSLPDSRSITASLPPAEPEKAEERVESPASLSPSMIKYRVKHWHNLGSCPGELRLSPQTIEFTSPQQPEHSFRYEIKDVVLDHNGILDPQGKAYHFYLEGSEQREAITQILSDWKNGGLFPGHTAAVKQATAAPGESRKPAERRYKAKHKHKFGIGSCFGDLILTPDALEFSSKEDYVRSHSADTKVEGKGIRTGKGEKWNFEIPGEDENSLLRSWKDGTLFK